MDRQFSPAQLWRKVLVKHYRRKMRFLLGAVVATLCLRSAVAAQGCALCYTQAAGSGPRLIHALWAGIAILVFPAMVLCVTFTAVAYRKRNRFRILDNDLGRIAGNMRSQESDLDAAGMRLRSLQDLL